MSEPKKKPAKKKPTKKPAEFEFGFHILSEKSGHWAMLEKIVDKFIVIDPDSKGCAVLRIKGSHGWGLRPAPLTSFTDAELYEWLKSHNCPVFIERQWARPMEGVSSSFKSGRQYGMVTGMAIIARHFSKSPLFFVNPATWSKDVPKEKTERVAFVNETMPQYLARTLLEKDHGIADAILFSEWVLKCLNQTKTQSES